MDQQSSRMLVFEHVKALFTVKAQSKGLELLLAVATSVQNW